MQDVGFIRDINLCAICYGKISDAEGGKIDPDLLKVYANVLLFFLQHTQEFRRKDIGRSLYQ